MSLLKYDGTVAAETSSPTTNLYGVNGAETLTGTAAAESLWGDQGGVGHLMIGGAGDDTLQAGSGADTFHSFAGAGIDEVLGFKPGVDHVQLDPGTTYTVSQVGADVVIALGGSDEMILKNVALSSLQSGWIFTG